MKHIFLCLMLFSLCLSPIMAQTRISSEYIVRTFIDDDGNSIDEIIVPGRPPVDHREPIVELPDPNVSESINILSNVPAFDWSYGCSATSGAMIAGYYDNGSYPNMYTGPTNAGIVPMNNSTWGAGECPLSATHQGYDGLAVRGHVDDYWSAYGSSIDPYYSNWTEHGYADCTADYMGTNQYYNWQNTDGSTVFYYYTNGSPIYDYTGCEPAQKDGCHGLREFFESRGYSIQVSGNYSQYIYGYNGNTQGFTYNQFKAEIDANRPVLIHIQGHTMVGFGYDDSTNLVYLHDTWDYSDHTMTWGGTYGGMQHFGVSVFFLQPVTGNMVEGHAYLENQTNHSGIEVLLERTVPSSLIYTISTNTSGYYIADIEPGIYDITYSKDGYFSEQLTEQSLYSTTTLPDITLIEHSSLLRVPSVFPTIQSAIDVCSVGDTILVAPGTYIENIQFNNKSPVLKSEAGPDSTIIDGNQGNAIHIESGGGVINGFTISESNYGVFKNNDIDYLLISDCVFINNSYAFYVYKSANTYVFNTLIYDNYYGFFRNREGGLSEISNCTFDNVVDIRFDPTWTPQQNILISNTILCGQVLAFEIYYINLEYCNYDSANIGANVNLFTGNITDDPMFVDLANHDYHLQPNSPCIDTGDPSAFCNDTNGTRNDMGYTGGSGLFIRRSNFDFGYNTCSSSSNQYLSISNHLAGSFTISSYNTNNSQFQVNESFPLTISSGDLYELELVFIPNSSGSTSGTITFNSDDLIGASSADIQVMGYGIDYTGGTIHVPSIAPTIQSAIDVCSIGDTILVALGTYVENIQFNNKSPVLNSESGPDSTIINGNQGDAIYINGGGGVINGFTIAESNRGILKSDDSDYLLISDCVFINNSYAIYIYESANTYVFKTLIYDNDYGFYQRRYGGLSEISNCTFDNVVDIRFDPYWTPQQNLLISNTILCGQVEATEIYYVNLEYCNYNPANIGANVNLVTGNITDDPMFVYLANHDYHLQPNSPCIDAGDPISPFDPDGTITDMGVYYFDQLPYFPNADFSADIDSGTTPLVASFTDLSQVGTLGYPITDWAWDFDNDGTIDSNEENPQWTYYERGNYSVLLSINDGTRSDVETKIDYITVINSQPVVIDSILDFAFDEDTIDTSINLNDVFNDADLPYGDSLSFSFSGNTDIQVVIVNGNVTLTPASDWFGSEMLTFTATDDQNTSISDDVEVTINSINDPPILNVTGTYETNEDLPSQTFDFSQYCSQTWGENDNLTLSADNSTHISVIITDFNVVFESNTPNWFGTEDIIFYLDDNVVTDSRRSANHVEDNSTRRILLSQKDNSRDIVSQTISVTVNPINDPPILNITGIFEADEDLPSQTYDFSQYCSQVWGETDVLTLTAVNSAHIDVTISDFTVTFQSNTNNWYGTGDIIFYLDDNVSDTKSSRDIVQQTIQVTIYPINDPPILNITGTFEADEDLPSQVYDFSQYCSQTWGETDALTLTADNSDHIDVSITAFDVVFESNTLNWYGVEDITFYLDDNVSDGRSSRDIVQQTIQVTINPVNDPPSIVLPDEFTFDEDNDLLVDFSTLISDIEPDNLTLSCSGNIDIIVNITGFDVTFSTPADWFGSEILTFTVDDNVTDATASDEVDVIVDPVNDPPILNITGSFEAYEDLPSQTYDFSQYCSQAWGETDVLALTASNSSHIDVSIVAFDVVFTSNTLNWYGTEDVTFYLDDNISDARSSRDIVQQTIQVTVNPVNDPPTIVLPDDFTYEEDNELIIDFEQYVNDVDDDFLTLSVQNNINVIVDIVDLVVTFTAPADWFGSEILTFIVDDNVTELTASDDVEVVVTPVNDPPILDITGTFEADEDLPSQTYDFSQYCSQVWGETDVLTLTADNSAHINVSITSFDVVFESNTLNWNGTEEITFYLNDNVNDSITRGSTAERQTKRSMKNDLNDNSRDIVEQTISVTINPVNDPPSIVLPDDFTFDEDNVLLVDFEQYISDIDEDDLTLSVEGNVNVLVNINGTEISFSAIENWNGDEILTFTVDDNATDATASDDVLVIVDPVNDPPEMISYIPEELSFTVVQDSIVTFIVEAEDIDSDLVYEWFVDGVLQTEVFETFVYQFQEVGSTTITSNISDGEYNIETLWEVTVEPVSSGGDILISATKLYQNYPNPFNPTTTIRFDIKEDETGRLTIFNLKGQMIVSEVFEAGQHSYQWNANECSTGLYFYRLRTDSSVITRKMVMMK